MQWLITGCSAGLGLSLAKAVLAQPGEKLIATSRNPEATPEVVKDITSHPNAVWEALDISAADLETQLDGIIAKHGPINVLINNAGYAIGGVFEATPLTDIRKQFETNFFGVVRTMHKLAPHMRENGKGIIVNISSSEVWNPHPGASVYAASKFAVDGLSQALATELAPFNVRVLVVQPGAMRTSFFDPAKAVKNVTSTPESYKGTVTDFVLQALMGLDGTATQDPDKTAAAIVQEVLEPTKVDGKDVVRLQSGRESVQAVETAIGGIKAESAVTKAKALECDFTH